MFATLKRDMMLESHMLISLIAAAAWASAMAQTEGCWTGELQYRDYQTNELQGIPVEQCVTVSPDGSLIAYDFDFTDPGFQVYSKVIVTAGEDHSYNEAYASRGRTEAHNYNVSFFEQESDQSWSMIIERFGEDDDTQAHIRHTIERNEDSWTNKKEIRPLGETSFQFRNSVILKKAHSE